jgi:Flp pilus assembly protein TadG
MRIQKQRRDHGAVAVEMALVLPVVFLMFIGLVVGGMGVFRYQEVAALAREGARYASVRGTAATETDIFENAVKPKAVAFDLSRLSCKVTWNQTNSPSTIISNTQNPVGNAVSVTVTYKWFPEWGLVGPITLSSTSTLPMSY